MNEILYRYESYQTASAGIEFDDSFTRSEPLTHIRLDTYKVVKHTPEGKWVVPGSRGSVFDHVDRRWMSNKARNPFAWPTKREALVSFKARKARQIQILMSQLRHARKAYTLVDAEYEKVINEEKVT